MPHTCNPEKPNDKHQLCSTHRIVRQVRIAVITIISANKKPTPIKKRKKNKKPHFQKTLKWARGKEKGQKWNRRKHERDMERERERERTTSPWQKLTGSSVVHKLALEEETWKQEQITISTRDLAKKNTYLGMLTTGGYWMKRSKHPCLREEKKCAAKLLSEEQNADKTLIRTRRTPVALYVSHTHTKLDYLLWMKSAHKTTICAMDEWNIAHKLHLSLNWMRYVLWAL